ncbi:hypothetical protein GQ42DRAFT_161320 [Ramicandelaber brevisporus]|nr:hypothetical protein GQ42DRAFT_161320 [Ramicandelaber brevisporus]
MPASLISQIAFPPVFDEPDPAANGHHANGTTATSAAATVATAITTAQETNGVHPVASLPSLADALMSVPRPPSLEPLSMPEPMYIDQPSDQHAISSLANSIMGDDDTAMADDSETTSSHMTQPERSNYLSHAMDILRR